MTEPPTPEQRLETAHRTVDELYEFIATKRYDGLPWLSAMRDIRTSLNDEDLAIPDRLAEAAETVRIMYRGRFNFSDFHFEDPNWDTMQALNQRLERLTDALKLALNGEPADREQQ